MAYVTPPISKPGSVSPTFWQQKWTQSAVPLASSLLLHIVIILLGLLTIQAGRKIWHVMQQQNYIPSAAIAPGELSGIPHPSLVGDPAREPRQNEYMNVPLESPGIFSKPGHSNTPPGGGSGVLESENAFLGPNSGLGKGTGGLGGGVGSLLGSGTGDGGQLQPFGRSGGGGGSIFAPGGADARKVAYVCDASGSMMSKFDYLRAQLQKSIAALGPVQGFNVIFFQETSADAISPDGLLLATPNNKQKAIDSIMRRMAHGPTDPIPALAMAFHQQPDLIYLLTDGDFPNNQAVVDFIHQANADHKVKINTIAFIDPGEAYEKLLKQIAAENGGTFKFVREEDLKN